MLQAIFKKLNNTVKNLPDCTVYEAFRVSLLQLEFKLLNAQTQQILQPLDYDRGMHYEPSLTLEQPDAATGCASNFNLIANCINSVGNFQHEGVDYYVRAAKPQTFGSKTVLFSKLRNVVKRLSNAATPVAERLRFYNTSALPGAVWGGRNGQQEDARPPLRRRLGQQVPDILDVPLLLNPDDFMPPHYDDISRFQDLISFCARKNVKYVSIDIAVLDSKNCSLVSLSGEEELFRAATSLSSTSKIAFRMQKRTGDR